MSRQTDDGAHEGYVQSELAGAWPGDDGALFAHWDDTTGSWWTSTWTSTRPVGTGRYRAACDAREGSWEHAREVRCRHWCGPIVTLEVPSDSLTEYTVEQEAEVLLAWREHVAADRVLDAVFAAWRALGEADATLHDSVRAARREGRTWDEIGRVLGITRQSAHERFRD